MSVEIVDVNSWKRNLLVEIPPEQVDEEIESLAHKYAQKIRVPGFRPGKVPLSVVKQRYASELRNDATQDLISRTWKAALSDHNLQPLAEPVVEHVEAKPGTPLKFTVSFEVLPPLKLENYVGLSATLPGPKVDDAEVEKALSQLREQHSQFVPVEDGVIQDGHMVSLTVDGEFEDGGKPLHEDDVVCIVGDERTNEVFSENLRGARTGEERKFAVTYPSRYQRKRFAGKTVNYKVVVKDIKEKQLPELNDDFARDYGGHENLALLYTRVRDDLVTKAYEDAEKTAREAVLDELVRRHSFEIPECMVRYELETHARRVASGLARQGIDINKVSIDWQKMMEEERPRAEQAVRRTLVLDAVARQETLTVSDEEVDEDLRMIAEATKKTPAAVRAQLEKDQRIQGFIDSIRHKKALDFIFRNANITRG